MTDFRALCAELLRGLDENRHPEVRYPGHLRLVMAAARAALAEPEPEGPSDKELLAEAAKALGYLSTPPWEFDLAPMSADDLLTVQRAVLTRWGHPAPVPVPVSERLQQMEDLAADAVSALRYIEQSHGRLYGIGWDRVYEKADQLRPAHVLEFVIPGDES